MSLLSLTTHLYILNQRNTLRLNRNNHLVRQLYIQTVKSVSRNELFFRRVELLYRVNNRRPLYLRRNHPFIVSLYNECKKLFSKKEYDKNKKAALLIGINYKGSAGELRGCENDVYDTKKLLISKYGYKPNDILILTETEKSHKNTMPTRKNILLGIQWLVEKADEGYGNLWFQYSGHGYYFKDANGDEKDGLDECLVSTDNMAILDDEFKSLLLNNLHKDVNLFCIMDCCHSGTMLDLAYKYRSDKNISYRENTANVMCNVVALSGCRDDQTSADAWFNGNFAGALTKTFLDVIKSEQSRSMNMDKLLDDVRNRLRKGRFEQIPQLTSSKSLNKNSMLTL